MHFYLSSLLFASKLLSFMSNVTSISHLCGNDRLIVCPCGCTKLVLTTLFCHPEPEPELCREDPICRPAASIFRVVKVKMTPTIRLSPKKKLWASHIRCKMLLGGRHLLLFCRFTGKLFCPKAIWCATELPDLNRPWQTKCTTQVNTRSI